MKLLVAGVLLSVVCVTMIVLAVYTGEWRWLIVSAICGYLVLSSGK